MKRKGLFAGWAGACVNAGGMLCGAPALVVVVLKFALRFSTLKFSTFLIV